MFKMVQIPILFALPCAGRDSASKQQQAADARREATAAELKQLGQSMHERQNDHSSSTGAAKEAPKGSDDSNQKIMHLDRHQRPTFAVILTAQSGDRSSCRKLGIIPTHITWSLHISAGIAQPRTVHCSATQPFYDPEVRFLVTLPTLHCNICSSSFSNLH